MVKFKVEIEVVLAEGSNPNFIFESIQEQLEGEEALTAWYVTEATEAEYNKDNKAELDAEYNIDL